MFGLWGFLLQTLTISGVAVLLLLIKALFQDKLPPRWQFAVWGVLGIICLTPAGWNGNYVLIHWPAVVESLKILAGEFGFTKVYFPIPVITSIPDTMAEWIFAVYTAGVIVHLGKYMLSYIRLRRILQNGGNASQEVIWQVNRVASQVKVKPCRIIVVEGLPSAFVCGVVRPVLAVPTTKEMDDKIVLHELLHLKLKDTIWSIVICILRSLHWCNPLLVYCAKRVTNDMEARCDQLVLECLEGEERREYGKILLAMVNEQFAKTPGTTCVNNGGKYIRERIEAIARFKKYPAGMGLVSICAILVLTASLVCGVQAGCEREWLNSTSVGMLASARSVYCTTPAGAFDTYAKAVLDQNGYYRIMCAAQDLQEELCSSVMEKEEQGMYPEWNSGLRSWPDTQKGYYIYNLRKLEGDAYEGLLVLNVNYLEEEQGLEAGKMYVAAQELRVEEENGRWIVIPLKEFEHTAVNEQDLNWGCSELPEVLYEEQVEEFQVKIKLQTIHTVANDSQNEMDVMFGTTFYSTFDTTPLPNMNFDQMMEMQKNEIYHIGTQEERDAVTAIDLSTVPVYAGEERPENLTSPEAYESSGGSSDGESWSSRTTEPGWGPELELGENGYASFDAGQRNVLPEYYVAELYLNGMFLKQFEIYPKDGEGNNEESKDL